MRALVTVFAVAAAFAAPSAAIACACCSEPGTWYQFKAPLRADERAELAKLRFRTANWVQTILQGRGNNCLNTRDLRSWHLDVSGGTERYSLYGTFR